jgi:hypothetical protein
MYDCRIRSGCFYAARVNSEIALAFAPRPALRSKSCPGLHVITTILALPFTTLFDRIPKSEADARDISIHFIALISGIGLQMVAAGKNPIAARRKARKGRSMRGPDRRKFNISNGTFMKKSIFAAGFLISSCLAGCVSSEKPQLSAPSESCRIWDRLAEKSAHPDGDMIKRHDALMAKAAAFDAEAQRNYNDPKARQAAIEKEVQARMDADAIYDTAYQRQVAKQCWEGVRYAQELRESAWRQRAAEADAPVQVHVAQPDYALHTQPPAPPRQQPVGSGIDYTPTRPNTWGNSPYGPMVPQVMRDQPIDSVNPMVPPVAR